VGFISRSFSFYIAAETPKMPF